LKPTRRGTDAASPRRESNDVVSGVSPETAGLTESGVPLRRPAPAGAAFGVVVWSRFLLMAVLAFLSWSEQQNEQQVSVLLVVAAFAQFPIAAVARQRGTIWSGFLAHDIIVTTLIVTVTPIFFWPAAVVLVSLMAADAFISPYPRYLATAVAVPLLLAVTGVVTQTDYFERGAGVAAVLAVGHGLMGRQLHRVAEATRRDLRFAIEAAGAYTHVTKLGEGLVQLSGDVESVVGWPRREWMTMDRTRIVHPDDQAFFSVDEVDAVPGLMIDRTGRVRTKDGRWIWLHDVSRVVDAGGHLELHGFTMDVTAQRAGLDRVTAEASTDALTGLANRRALVAELADLAETAVHHLVLIDLNRFKDVNDTLGHDAGDVLLRVVADRIAESISDREYLARLGGDEFAVVYRDDVPTDVVMASLENVAAGVSRPVEINGVQVSTSISAGVVRARPSQADRSTMLRQADIAMYSAKRGRRTAVFFDDSMGVLLEQRLALSREVSDALSSGDLLLHFQAIVEAHSGEITGVEGLARWEHPVLGLLEPDTFLDMILLSEQSGDFTRTMVRMAITAAARFVTIGHSIPVSVNVPVRSIEDRVFEDWFVAECSAAGLERDRIVFEVAERDLHDGVATAEAINRLSRLRVKTAVDDFGTGHATFERLRWRNVSQIKLDRDIIQSSVTDPRDEVIVRSIVDLTHTLGFTVVAEGVEHIEQLEVLRAMGCEGIQGFLFSKPVALADFIVLLRRGRLDPIAQ